MHKKSATLLAIGVMAAAMVTAATPQPATPQHVNDYKWPVGEKLTYRLYWGVVPVGTAVTWTEWVEVGGRQLLAIRLRTRSNNFIEKIYPVDDTIESLVDPITFLPVQFTKNLSEGAERRYEITTFDRTNKVAHWHSKLSDRRKLLPIPPDVRDIPTLMYSLRSHTFTPGARERFQVMADEKVYEVIVNIIRKESLDLPRYGKVRSIKTEPEAAFEGIFVRRGRLWVWISDDERCLATKVEASIPVANVRAVLWSVEGPGNDSWVSASTNAATRGTQKTSP